MSKESKEEKLFSELVDRIIAGESVDIDVTDTDMRSAIDFAKKIKELRTNPAEPFKARLKARLLQQLRDKETVPVKTNWWQRIFANRMAWQLATTAALILIAVGVTWRVGFYQPNNIDDLTAMPPKSYDGGEIQPGTENSLLATSQETEMLTNTGTTETFGTTIRSNAIIMANAVTDKPTYLPGEAVNITVYLTNEYTEPIEIPPYPPVLISDSNHNIVYTFGALNGTTVLLPGKSFEFKIVWNRFDSNNNSPAAPGIYYIAIANIIDNENNISISNTANKFEIK